MHGCSSPGFIVYIEVALVMNTWAAQAAKLFSSARYWYCTEKVMHMLLIYCHF